MPTAAVADMTAPIPLVVIAFPPSSLLVKRNNGYASENMIDNNDADDAMTIGGHDRFGINFSTDFFFFLEFDLCRKKAMGFFSLRRMKEVEFF